MAHDRKDFVGSLQNLPKFLITLLLTSTITIDHVRASLCATEFETIQVFPKGPVTIELGIDFLVQFDTSLKAAAANIRSEINSSGSLNRQMQQTLTNEFEERMAQVSDQYEDLLNKALEWSADEGRREFPSRAEGLRRSGESLVVQTRTAIRRENGASFDELSENPELISPRLTYEVPQPSSTSGAPAANKLTVKFSTDVISELRKDPQMASRFMRSMIKGYIGPHSGDGILRITDQHEALVEIKFVSKGNHRLMGCRRPGGLIEILKFYEKHSDGGGGSLKRFAKLCD